MDIVEILTLRRQGLTWNQIDMKLLDVDKWKFDKKGKIFSQAWKLMVKLGYVVMKSRPKKAKVAPVSMTTEFAM